MNAYNQPDWQKASVGAYQLLKDPRVKDEISSLEGDFRNVGYLTGVTKEKMVWILKDMMEATKVIKKEVEIDGKRRYINEEVPDHKVRYDWVMWFAKLTGDLTEKKPLSVDEDELPTDPSEDTSEMSTVELRKKREEILAKMFQNKE